jgi:hypothetical protein
MQAEGVALRGLEVSRFARHGAPGANLRPFLREARIFFETGFSYAALS